MSKIIKFIILFLPWLISGLFTNPSFFEQLNLPFFALPKYAYGIVWFLLYLFIAYSIYKIYSNYKIKDIPNYNKALILNYLFNQLFMFFFFYLKSPFLGFIDTLGVFISSLLLYYETDKLDSKAARVLKPYIIFNIYAVILSLTIYFMNF